MNPEKRDIIKLLNNLGVDTRFISLYENVIYINNIKFSKFSRKRQDKFLEYYPDIKINRSKAFGRIAIKASRTIKNQITPREKIYVSDGNKVEDTLLEIILEPYERKYGITITDQYDGTCKVAKPKILDEFATEYINLMIEGKRIQDNYEDNTIYPLMHVSREMINDWIKTTDLKYSGEDIEETIPVEILKFLEMHIPNVAESIKQSVTYLDENRID